MTLALLRQYGYWSYWNDTNSRESLFVETWRGDAMRGTLAAPALQMFRIPSRRMTRRGIFAALRGYDTVYVFVCL